MVREAGHEAADLSDERSELACTERDEQVGVAELRLWLNEASSPYGGLWQQVHAASAVPDRLGVGWE
jgi:hypothetical protein